MTAVIVPLAPIRRLRHLRRNALASREPLCETAADSGPRPVGPVNDLPVDRAQTLDAAQRNFLAVEDALDPWADSVLIAQLVLASPAEREAIVRELEERRP